MLKMIPIKSLVRDLRFYPRRIPDLPPPPEEGKETKKGKKKSARKRKRKEPRVTDWRIVLKYKEALQTGAKFPPIKVVKRKGQLILISGHHRCDAHLDAGREEILAEIITKPMTDAEIFALSVKENVTHGRTLSVQERIAAAQRLLKEFKCSAQKVQDTLQMTLRSIKRLIDERIVDAEWIGPGSIRDKDGHTLRNTKKAPIAGFEVEGDLDAVQRSMAAHDQRQIFHEAYSLLKHKLIDMGDEVLVSLVRTVGKLIQRGGFGKKRKRPA